MLVFMAGVMPLASLLNLYDIVIYIKIGLELQEIWYAVFILQVAYGKIFI